MDHRVLYTKFPNLFDTAKTKSGRVALQTKWPVSLPQEILILSWASLLQSYTSITEPVFSFEGQAVQANTFLGSWNKVEAEGVNERDDHHTSVALKPLYAEPVLALELWYDGESGSTALASASSVPYSFLPQILSQLEHKMSNQAASDDFSPPKAPLLSIVNPERQLVPGPHFLHQLVHAASPSMTAIDFLSSNRKRVQLSYQDLHRLSDRLAKRLDRALSRSYDQHEACTNSITVPILIPQSPQLYISQLAILRTGAAFCPLHLDVPQERLKFIMEDVGAKVVVTTQECRHRFSHSNLGFEIFSLVIDEEDESHIADLCVSGHFPAQQHAEKLAYIMYTSGSTGLPKGVGISHQAVTQALLAHDKYVPRYHRFLQFAAPTFDVSIFEIFFTFYRGATLVCCHRENMLNDLTGVMNALRVDAAELTPTVAGTLLRNWSTVPSLNLLLTIGEVLPTSVIEKFEPCPDRGRVLLPMYGPTEASIHCTVAPTINSESKAGIIGQPLSTVSAFVIAEEQTLEPHILPVGFVGELAIGGQLAQGYINRPEQTHAAFVTLPSYGLVYRSGDRVRLLPSGQLEYLGRIASGQVKIRGQRVELGEVEQIICQVESVRFSVCSIIEGNLIAFCLIHNDAQISTSRQALQEKCKSWLNPIMCPQDFVILTEQLPRLPSGKVDRRSLESLYLSQRLAVDSATPNTGSELESFLADVVRKELSIDVTYSEDLWSKGLDSLRAISLASKLRHSGIEVSATDILAADTIATLSEALQQRQTPHSVMVAVINSRTASPETMKDMLKPRFSTAQFSEIEDIVPCSKLQSAMLAESVIAKHINFNWLKIEIANSISVEDFMKAFRRLAELNEILRSGFVQSDEQESGFARIVWKRFDCANQIEFEQHDPGNAYGLNEVSDMSLLQPLRFKIASVMNNTTVSVCIHHALYDGWSWDLMMTDINLLIQGKEPPKRPQFQQFVQCEEAFLSSEIASTAQDYWMDHLRGAIPTPLPVLNIRKCTAEIRTFRRAVEINLSLLNSMSKRLRVSRHSIASAAFATLLKLYCGTSEIVFGSVSSGRTLSIPGIENIIGPCISTLPIRINFDHLRTVGDLLLHTHQLHHNFLHFGQVPLRDIKRAAGITGDQVLFDALFVWQESLESNKETKSSLSVIDGTDFLQYALVFELEPGCHQVQVKATYDTSVLCIEQVELLVNQFGAILDYYTVASHNLWEDILNQFKPHDLSIANTTFSGIDCTITISTTIDRLAREDPTRVAIEFVDDFDPLTAVLKRSNLTYGELSERAGLVAQFLLAKGILVDEIVCLFMNKSIPLYVSILGVLKAGAAYIVIDPQAPPERTRRIIEGVKCRYCLTSVAFQGHDLLGKIQRVLFFDEIAKSAQHDAVPCRVDDTNLAYAVFTSGSSGIPKGVLITRKNILSNIDVLSRLYPSVESGTLLQACSPAFDVSVFEILYAWHMGMRLCATSNDILFRDMERLIGLLNVTHLSLTPSVAALIRPSNVPNVQMLVTAGEAVTSKVFRDWSDRGLYQGYGPSETTNICSVRCKVSISDHINNIGHPLPNTSMFISNSEAFCPLPKGALGEIWIGGDQVGRGYLNDPSLTAERFIDHLEYGKLYRSGDLGRMLPDGSTLFHGRQDDQIKLRGQRIELGEIEHTLLRETAVSDSICLVTEHSEQTPSRLIAYWSLLPSSKVDTMSYNRSLFEKLQSQLPTYMVPDYLIPVEMLPLTSQGKADRKVLKQMYLNMDPAALKKYARQGDNMQEMEPMDINETSVARAIAEVTGSPLSVIDRNTSFFALGLDSISCISLSRKLLESGFGVVDASLILRHASISKLLRALPAIQVARSTEHGGESKLRQIFDEEWQATVRLRYTRKGYSVQKILPCTPLQQAMLFHAEGGRSGAYQNQLTFTVFGDLQQLQDAWSTCISSHEILRTGFVLTSSSQFPFAQIVLADYVGPWHNGNHSDQAETEWEGLMVPPYSFTVEKKSNASPLRLILQIHHALYDAQSMSLLIHDVERAYRGGTIEAAVSVEPYLDYMVGLAEESADQFWRAHLVDYQPKLLSPPPQKQKAGSRPQESNHHICSRTSLGALLESSKQMNVTLLTLLQLTWARLLAKYSNVTDICFGNVYSGRNLPIQDIEKIIGPCFNTLPVRTVFGRHDTNQQVAKRLRDHTLAALSFQPSSLRGIQQSLGVRRLFDTMLLLQGEPPKLCSSIWALEEDLGHMKFPLVLELVPTSHLNQLEVIMHVEQDILPLGAADLILADFDSLLGHTIRYPDALAIDCSVLGHREPFPLIIMPDQATATQTEDRGPHLERDWSPLERHIFEVFSRLSDDHVFNVSRNTTIFHLGFDSLSAIQIAAELRKEGYRLSSGDILEAATVPGIASLCETHFNEQDNLIFDFDAFSDKHISEVCERHCISRQAVEEIRPCTKFQSRVLAGFLRSTGHDYLNSVYYKLEGHVDTRLLRNAWEAVSLRHDILRTGFVEIEDVQCPFAMILYSSRAHALPWLEDDGTAPNDSAYARSLLQSLQEPPWRVVIGIQGSRRTMRISMLHALFDARTFELLLDEVATAYRGERLGIVIPIKPCISRILYKSSSQPADTKAIIGDLSIVPSTRFPDLHSHTPKDGGFHTIEFGCSRSLAQLQASCRKAGVTLQVAGQCAWARLLSAYTGEKAPTFGVVLSGRSVEDGEDSVLFPCISTVPVSIKVEGTTNRALLAAATRQNSALLKNPFALSQGWSSAQGDLFDTLFVLQNRGKVASSFLWHLLAEDARANYTVSVEMLIDDFEKLCFRLTLRKQFVPIEQGKLLVKQLDASLLDTLERLDDEASKFIHVGKELISIAPAKEPMIGTRVQYLHQFVEIMARDYPKKIAFEFATKIVDGKAFNMSWSYSQLDEQGNRVAHILHQNGASPGDLIGVCFDKCPEASFTILGILKAGCGFLAIDPSAPEARKRFILHDSKCRVLCTTQDKAGSTALTDKLQVLSIDKMLQDKGLPCNAVSLSRKLVGGDVCYCLYTSGTTGTPKGCLITHGNAVQFVLAFQRLFAGSWDADSRFLQFASFHFDVSVMEQYWSWSIGICVTSASRDLLFEDLPAAIRALHITHIDLTPSLARLLTPEECPSLSRGAFITGGEQLRQDIIDAWGDVGVIYNGYGPSEVTIGCTMYPRIPKTAKPSNIGCAYDNVGAYVLEPGTEHLVLKGAIGELCVSGPLVGKGYLNRAELTAEKFRFLNNQQAQVYRTGDLVRLLHDGSFCFIGRADDQVKLRGQRLEIGEINHIIRQASKMIKEVATMVLRHHKGSKEQLVAFVALSERRADAAHAAIDFNTDHRALLHHIRRSCNSYLPAYMIPTFIIPLIAMPLSTNNKIDTKPLRALFEATSATDLQELSGMGTSLQHIDPEPMRTIVESISRVIGHPEEAVLPSSRLFELGLDSISAISLSRLLKRAGFDAATPSMIMRNPVVGDMVTALTENVPILEDNVTARQVARQRIVAFEKTHRAAIKKAFHVRDHEIEKIAPCTPLQEGMIARCLSSGASVYFSSFIFVLDADLDIIRLQAAWTRVEEENEILRTKFVPTNDGYAQVVFKDSATPSARFQHLPIKQKAGYEDALKHNFEKWAERVRTFEEELWGLDLYHVPEHRLLHLKIFHGLYDGISLGRMLDEVACIYAASSTPSPKPSYHDVLPLGPLLLPAGAEGFWRQNHNEVKLLDLPLKHDPNTAIAKSSNIALSKNMRELQMQLCVTEAAIFQACWLMTLKKKFEIFPAIGIVVSGRAIDADGMENVVGPLFNTIPCQITADASSTLAELVKTCHTFNVKAMPYHHTSLSSIRKWMGLKSTEPLFDSLFVFQKAVTTCTQSRELWTQIDSNSQPDYPLAIEVEQGAEHAFTCTIVAQGQYLCCEEVQELLDVFGTILIDLYQNLHKPSRSLRAVFSRPLDAQSSKIDCAGEYGSKELTNGAVHCKNDFRWDAMSDLMRREIANLSRSDVHSVAPYTSIYELGLDSIDAIKLSSRFKAAGTPISVSSILKAGSIAEMVKRISAAGASTGSTSKADFDQICKDLRKSLENQAVPVDNYLNVLPVTPLQETMLANYQQYYSQDVLRLSGDVDTEKLKSAWRVAFASHDILRTVFMEVEDLRSGSIYAQLVPRNIDLECISTSVDSEAQLQILLSDQESQAVHEGISSVALRLTFVDIGSTTYLIVGLPHAVYDGWSINLLHQDVARCYNGLQCERPNYEPVLEHILGSVSEKSCLFWSKHLSDLHTRPFGSSQAERRTPGTPNRHEISSRVPVTPVVTFCKAAGVTLQSLALTCWALALARYTKSRDVCFGVVLAGRDIENADQMMFPTMNTVPFRVVIKGSKLETVKRIHYLILAISEHQHFPLRKAKSLVKGSAGHLFDTLFMYQKKPSQTEQLKPLYTSVGGSFNPEYPVNVEMELLHEDIIWRTACKNHVLDMRGTQALLHDVDSVLDSLIVEPSTSAFTSSPDGSSNCNLPALTNGVTESHSHGTSTTVLKNTHLHQPGFLLYEEAIREVLSNISNVEEEKITESTSLFHLGLDSISAIKVSSALKKRSISLPVSEMLRTLTVQGMAKAAKPLIAFSGRKLANHRKSETRLLDQNCVRNSLKEAGILEDQVEDIFPCTSGQEFFLGLWQASGGKLFYPEFCYQVQGRSVSRQTINTAWQRLLQAVPVLRTVFLPSSNPYASRLQIVLKDVLTPVIWAGERAPHTKAANKLPAHYDHPPVFLYATETPTAILLKLRIHHALYDGVSLPRIMQAFRSFCDSSSDPLDLEIGFQNHLDWLQNGTTKHQRKTFWASYLNGISAFQPRRTAWFEAERVEIFRPKLIDGLSPIAQKLKENVVSFQALFFAAYARAHSKILARLTCTIEELSELVVGVYLANRSHDHEGLSTLLAPTVNVVPLKIPVRHESSLFETARAVQEDLARIGSIEQCAVSLSEVYEWTGVRIDCFLNFLKLPGIENTSSSSETEVEVQEVGLEDWPQHSIIDHDPPLPLADHGICTQNDSIYLPSIDIEAAIRNDALDVGVFAPSGLLDRPGAENLLAELQALLRSCQH
ncbi:hypothetical protein GJ744_002897 [Endocarpon pusillum]|uniref:Nonribosomal peptide synthetase sidC n=1 Tax=Endocarpon pusillum TaxID=364733 RepID=A0A8H7A7K0_9EURO|nr:hypothetical protein GJ744_002897 [Endocarpon pusillum]